MASTEITQPALINGMGRIPSWNGDEECDSVSFPEDMDSLFQQQLINIDEEMGIDDLSPLKFLCVDYIPVSKLESATSPLDVFMHMRKATLIDVNNVDFLLECLGRIHRFDLVRKLAFDPDQVKADMPNLQKVTPYRRLLMELAEDMDDKDLQKMTFYLTGRIKKNKLSKVETILDLFVITEKEQITSAHKPEALIELMGAIGRPDLVTAVNEFMGAVPERPTPVCNRVQRAENPINTELGPAIGEGPLDNMPVRDLRNQELPVGSGSSTGMRPGVVDRSASAGTLIVSESESGSYNDEATGGDSVPAELLRQVAVDVRHQFNDLGIELGFTNDQIEEFNEQYRDSQERTRHLLVTWQTRKLDKNQIGPGLHYALSKLGQKNAAAAIKQWMESRYHGNQQSGGQRVGGAQNRDVTLSGQRAAGRPVFDINYTSSTSEARPPVFPPPAGIPAPVGPPQSGYDPTAQSENVCVSLREAQPLRDLDPVDPQVQAQNLQQIEDIMRTVNISGQLPPQQILTRYSQAMHQMKLPDPSAAPPAVALGNQGPQGPVQGNPVAPVARANPGPGPGPAQAPVSHTDQDAMPSTLPEYDMKRKPRGWCIIINNKEFKVNLGDRDAKEMPPRIGTDKDAESLQIVFDKLGFEVRRRDNLSDTEVLRYLGDVAYNVDHRLFDCLVVCILTHGVENHIYGSNGKLVSIKDITSTFQSNRCPHLAGKPKLFFLQACQGRNKMEGQWRESPGNDLERDARPNSPRYGGSTANNVEIDGGKEMIPNEADFLIGYATVPGFVSFRSRNNGSWYIRKLCELLEKYHDRHDLLSILVEVNREVSNANAQIDGGIFKQTPAPLVTLRKKLFFHKLR